jgi:hypothetical protein
VSTTRARLRGVGGQDAVGTVGVDEISKIGEKSYSLMLKGVRAPKPVIFGGCVLNLSILLTDSDTGLGVMGDTR